MKKYNNVSRNPTKIHVNVIENVMNLEIVEQAEIQEENNILSDKNLSKSNSSLEFEPKYCSSCLSDYGEFSCGICDNYFQCMECSIKKTHLNHPLIPVSVIPHLRVENISMMNFESFELGHKNLKTFTNLAKYHFFKNNRKYFGNRGASIRLSLQTNNVPTYVSLKKGERIKFPVEVINLSHTSIDANELLVTTKNNGNLKTENQLIGTKIRKNERTLNFIEFTATNESKYYEFEIILLHSWKKLEYDPVKIVLQVV